MTQLHLESHVASSSRNPREQCGDQVLVLRRAHHTLVLLVDGMGHGIRAHLAATSCMARLATLVEGGGSLREAFSRVAASMNASKHLGGDFAAFTVARILPGGQTTILIYEMPLPCFVTPNSVTVLKGRALPVKGALALEVNCLMEASDSLVLYSDGVTQAGMGLGLTFGWTEEGVASFLREKIQGGRDRGTLSALVHTEARRLWGAARGDDVTALTLLARPGRKVTVLSGPPSRRDRDPQVVRAFMEAEGKKVVCGGSTAAMVARHLGGQMQVEQRESSKIAPPRYFIDGVDLVTEGAVTLNQLYNIFHKTTGLLEPQTGVSLLHALLHGADEVHFMVGDARNMNDDITFAQLGVLPRPTVVKLLGAVLEADEKLVTISLF